MPPVLAVQIVNYRTRAYLERCLVTLRRDLQESGIDHEILLLDNDSGEDLTDLADPDARVRAFSAPRNLGFGAGHNMLASHTGAELLWILNPDTEIVQPRTAGRLVDRLRATEVQAIGPRLISPDGTPEPYDHGRLAGPRAKLALRGGHSYWRATERRRRVAWVSGAALMLEHEALRRLRGFDERLFLYKEEEDLCLRVRASGGTVLYDPTVVVSHVKSVVAGQGRFAADSQRYFIAKHCSPGRAQRLCARAHQGLAYIHL